jgi:hypothetical protein
MPLGPRRGPILLLVLAGVVTTPFGYLATSYLHISGWARLPISFALGTMTVAGFALMVREGIRAVERVTLAGLPYNRKDATPPVSLSLVQSLVSRGDADGASRLFDDLLVKHGFDDELCRTAVDFHAFKGGSPRRAEEILRAMRTADATRHERFATQRLIDLYVGVLNEPHRALPELRRVAERYAGTREGNGALDALQRLKANNQSTWSAARGA